MTHQQNIYPRLIFVDYLRFTAVTLMLQGHTFDALLSPQIKTTYEYNLFNFIHGLTAPMFFFGSGFAFAVSTVRHFDDYTEWSPKLQRRVRRFVGLILLGFFLHLPYFSLNKLLRQTPREELFSLLNIDTLQCIGMSLLILQFLFFLFRDENKFLYITLSLSAISFLIAPFIKSSDLFSSASPLIATLFSDKYGSIFPLVPWFGFIACGSAAGQLFLIANHAKQPERFVLLMMIIGGAMVLGGIILIKLNLPLCLTYDYSRVNPFYNSARLGIIMLFCGFLWYFEQQSRKHLNEFAKKHIRPLQMLGRESLAVYTAHLFLLYGSPLNKGASFWFGNTFSLPQSIGAFGILFLSMLALAIFWNEIKKRYPAHIRFVLFSAGLVLAAIFLTVEF